MSEVSLALGRRSFAVPVRHTAMTTVTTAMTAALSAPVDSPAAIHTLADLGQAGGSGGVGSVVITGYDASADPATVRRLIDLGLTRGARVEFVRKAPLRDPIVFRVAGYDIALRRAQARMILTDRV